MFSKKNINDIPIEETPHSTGSRKLIVSKNDVISANFEAMTYGYLPSKEKWVMHNHINILEICLVINGSGRVRDANGNAELFKPGDRFIFPAGIDHEIENTSPETDEFYFFRLKDK